MIDFHSHIIYNVDDGSNSKENSIKLLKQASNAGFNKIILTPHYIKEYYECNTDEIKSIIEELENECKNENIDLKLYQANEIYISNHIVEFLQNKLATTINNSKYVLFELPMNEEPLNLLEVVYDLKDSGYIPIIAHPERYTYIQKDPNKLLELIDLGVLFQANYGSIIGQYGKDSKKTVTLLLKNNFIHFLGSDVHVSGNTYKEIENIFNELRKILDEEQIEELIEKNIEKVLNDEEIETREPIEIKKSIFNKFF